MEKQWEDIDVKFLIGLSLEFEVVWAQILGGKEVSTLAETSYIQRSTLSDSIPNGDHSAFIARGSSLKDGRGGQSGRVLALGVKRY